MPGPDGDAIASITWLHERYAGPLFAYAYRSTGSRETAEEIVQDALVRAWQHVDRFDPERASIGTWLFTITRNLIIDQHRRSGARPRTVATLDEVAEPTTQPELDRVLEAWQVGDALRGLTDQHRDVILETYYRGSSVAQASERLGIPEGTVKSRLYYGLRNLRLALEEQGVVR